MTMAALLSSDTTKEAQWGRGMYNMCLARCTCTDEIEISVNLWWNGLVTSGLGRLNCVPG